MYTNQINHGSVAQRLERWSSKPRVVGSNPSIPTIFALVLAAAVAALPGQALAKPKQAAQATSKKVAPQAKAALRSSKGGARSQAVAAEPEPETPRVELVKAPRPVRSELGCNDQEGNLAPVGKVLTVGNKHLRCQQTYDFPSGKLEATPGWVELFMPSATLGAGLRETTLPSDMPMPALQAKPSKPEISPEDVPLDSGNLVPTQPPASSDQGRVSNYMF